MTRRKLNPLVHQLIAQGDPWANRTDPTCANCKGAGHHDGPWVWFGAPDQTECWECEGTGLQPWARKKDTE